MFDLVLLGIAILVVALILYGGICFVSGGDVQPGEWGNPWIDIPLSQVEFMLDSRLLRAKLELGASEARYCINAEFKYRDSDLLIQFQRADAPRFQGFLYSLANKSGKYEMTKGIRPGTKRVLYGPDLELVLEI